MERVKALYAYPSSPAKVGEVIEATVGGLQDRTLDLHTWKDHETPGEFISDGVLTRIDDAEVLIADITRLNFNVTFEIGYALGQGKVVIPTINTSLTPPLKEIARLGMFDSLVFQKYQNSQELGKVLRGLPASTPPRFPQAEVDFGAPVYVLNLNNRTDMAVRLVARIKKSRIKFRSFDPLEQPRLSAQEAYRGVASSVAIVVLLVSDYVTDHFESNLRGAFIAGIAHGMGKTTVILQDGDSPVPVDFREFVQICRRPDDVDRHIADLAPRVIEGIQNLGKQPPPISASSLGKLDLGESAAENEMSHLASYYLATAQFRKVLTSHIRLVVGRKGSGKTAMFVQIRDKIRSDKKRIVLDLRPEGYQLKKFKEMLLSFSEASQEHLSTAFWEYTLLLELCQKILDKDKQVYAYNRELTEPYQRLHKLYHNDEYVQEGDFSERMLQLVQRIMGSASDVRSRALTTRDVVEVIYRHDINSLRGELVRYLTHKKDVWILFDNIDKGWPTKGVQSSDILVLRGLLEATRDIERLLERKSIATRTIVFLRNDVYELLVDATPDRGKESKVSLEWTNPDLLKEMLRLRIMSNEGIPEASFDKLWTSLCVSHVDGVRSDDVLVELSLMRPRYLINLVGYSIANAVNLSHPKITMADLLKAASEYSADVALEVGLEIRDVFPAAEDVLYAFIGCPRYLRLGEVFGRFKDAGVPDERHAALLEVLLWFSFFGVVVPDKDIQYSYTVYYDMKKLKTLAGGLEGAETRLAIHPAFHPFLEIE